VTGILRNDSASPFRKIPIADFPHSAFYHWPANSARELTHNSAVVIDREVKFVF